MLDGEVKPDIRWLPFELNPDMGIAFAFDRIERTPNTRAARQLIDLAQSQGAGARVVLAAIAAANGVSGWPGQANATGVAEIEESVRSLGISAVPTFTSR